MSYSILIVPLSTGECKTSAENLPKPGHQAPVLSCLNPQSLQAFRIPVPQGDASTPSSGPQRGLFEYDAYSYMISAAKTIGQKLPQSFQKDLLDVVYWDFIYILYVARSYWCSQLVGTSSSLVVGLRTSLWWRFALTTIDFDSCLRYDLSCALILFLRQVISPNTPSARPPKPACFSRSSGKTYDKSECDEGNCDIVSARSTYIIEWNVLLQLPLHTQPPWAYNRLPTAVPVSCPQNAASI